MSLRKCLKAAGKALNKTDADRMKAEAEANEGRGMPVEEAEKAAVDAMKIDTAAARTTIFGADVSTPVSAQSFDARFEETTRPLEQEISNFKSRKPPTADDAPAIGALRGRRKWWQGFERLFFSATDNLRATKGGKMLADAVDQYFRRVSERHSAAMKLIRKEFVAYEKLNRTERQVVNSEFARYWEANDHAPQNTDAIYAEARQETRDLIDAWKKVAKMTGDDLVAMGVKVLDGKRWRKLRQVKSFFPRTPDPEIRRILTYPGKYQKEYNELADALIDGGHIQSRSEMDQFAVDTLLPQMSSTDHFAGIEKARGDLLPAPFYKRDLSSAINYIERWSDRASQIEAFGQKTGMTPSEGDLFDGAMRRTGHENTKRYIRAVQSRVYNESSNDIITRIVQHLNVAATALQLGNPATATLNLIGGTALNIVTFGNKAAAAAFREVAREGWRVVRDSMAEMGVIRESYLPLMRDIGSEDAMLNAMGREVNFSAALRRATEFTLKWGGYTPTEHIIRAMGALTGKHYLFQTLKMGNTNPDSAQFALRREWFRRNGFDFGRLVKEGGTGEYTEQFMRYAAMLPQGSYRVDQTPVFVDTSWGRFLFKYQKFGTQVNRLFYMNHLEPFMKTVAPGSKASAADRAAAAIPMIQYLGGLFLAGEAIGLMRQALFDYIRKGPQWDEMVKAFEDDDRARAFGLTASRAYHAYISSGAMGFLGNYTQFFRDFTQQERVKNPLDPPGLASVHAISDLALRLQGQRTLTTKDLNDVLQMNISIYRTYSRAVNKGINLVTDEYWLGQRQAQKADVRYIRDVTSRYAKEMQIEGSRVTGSGAFGRTPMSPINRSIADAMREGNMLKARQIRLDHLRGLRGEKLERAKRSMQASLRNARPVQIHGNPVSEEQRQEFLRWARQNLSRANYLRILEREREWRRMSDYVLR